MEGFGSWLLIQENKGQGSRSDGARRNACEGALNVGIRVQVCLLGLMDLLP